MMTQCDRVYGYLLKNRSINPLQAWSEIGVYRLGARVWDLKNKYGVKISKDMVTVHNKYGEPCKVARYRLED